MNRRLFTQYLLLVFTVSYIRTNSAEVKGSLTERRKHKSKSSQSKIKVDKWSPWPFLPRPGYHYSAASKGYPSYPFMILSPPDKKKVSEEVLKDQKGSKYFISRRQTVPYPVQQAIVGYVPIFYTAPPLYNTYQPLNYYQPGQSDIFGNAANQQLFNGGQMMSLAGYPQMQNPFLFFKRSKTKKPNTTLRDKNQITKRQFLPRHHWAFSQWPFDSHEYAFTKDPLHSLNVPHLPRWGPTEWGGAGPLRHWAINREGLPSPFGIGLAPFMGGQGYIGLAGRWPMGHGYPFPTNYPTHPHHQHLLP